MRGTGYVVDSLNAALWCLDRAATFEDAVLDLEDEADDPPDEPPGERDGSHGFRVTPQSGLLVKPECANSGVVVLATTIAPAAFSRRTMAGSKAPMLSASVRDPRVVSCPLVGVKSLIEIGRPSIGPVSPPALRAASATRAAAMASSAKTAVKALNVAFTAPIR